MADLDQSGQVVQWAKIYLGPTLGWINAPVQPQRIVTAAGVVTIAVGDYAVLINKTVGAATTVNLPSVGPWLLLFQANLAQSVERALWIKDLKGDAATNNITVHPFGVETIDGLAQDFTIGQNRQLLRLYPRADATGWISG